MRSYDNIDMIGVTFYGFLIGLFIGLCLVQHFKVIPLKQEAIKRGYATFAITETNKPTQSHFTWK